MQRVTITLDDDLLADIDRLVVERGYQGRSEAIRDLARTGLSETSLVGGETGHCVAALVYVYDHAARELSKRLTTAFHDQHELSLTTLHVHLDHGSCMEVSVLKGDGAAVRAMAERVIAERGVRHGRAVIIPMRDDPAATDSRGHPHHHHHGQVAGGGAAEVGGRKDG
jgi:CopG family transcriptional regulator, nickel-responsive regulator